MGKMQSYVWVDADGRQHTAWLLWSGGRWCMSINRNESVGSPSLIPLPKEVPPSPDPPLFIPRSVVMSALNDLEAGCFVKATRTLARACYPMENLDG